MITKNKLTKKFSTIPNSIIIDTSISAGALRVYAYLVSKPDGWSVANADIQEKLQIKQSQTLANYWKELINSGWISRERSKDANGLYIGGFNYVLNDESVSLDNVEVPETGKINNMDLPHCGFSLIREIPQYINKTELDSKTEYNKKNIKKEKLRNKVACVGDFDLSDFNEEEISAIERWINFRHTEYRCKKSSHAIKVVINHLCIVKQHHNIARVIEYFMNYTTMQNITMANVIYALKQKHAQEANNAA